MVWAFSSPHMLHLTLCSLKQLISRYSTKMSKTGFNEPFYCIYFYFAVGIIDTIEALVVMHLCQVAQ